VLVLVPLVLAVVPLLLSCSDAGRMDETAGAVALRTTPANDADGGAPTLVIFSAFPAEMAPILAETQVDHTVEIGARTFYVGTLRGVPVTLGLTGIGLANARATAQAVLAALPVSGVVFSGVAGGLKSPLRIADVAIPTTWSLSTGESYHASPEWLALASSLSASPPCYEQCTVVQWTGDHVCLDRIPALAMVDEGRSEELSQSSGPCDTADGNDVFGCDIGTPQGATETCQTGANAAADDAGADPDAGAGPATIDNETAAVAAEAAARGLPFIGFRGVSDGAGDPLGLPGFPGEFFAYYRLAARNVAATTLAFVERLTSSRP
jgi:nucleoside phosphorylase